MAYFVFECKDRETERSALQQLLVQMAISEYTKMAARVCPCTEISGNFLFYDVIAMGLLLFPVARTADCYVYIYRYLAQWSDSDNNIIVVLLRDTKLILICNCMYATLIYIYITTLTVSCMSIISIPIHRRYTIVV